MGLLSVIIPIYNGRKYIADTINMVRDSDYSDIEIIAVNDGSKDDSAEIVAELQKKDSRIHLYNKENQGVVSARNYGVDHANGDYICFVDQDDFVKPFMYSKMISKMNDDCSDIAMCSSGRNVTGNESVFDYQKDGTYEGNAVREELLFPILFNGFDVPVKYAKENHYPHIWVCVFRKTFWDRAELKFRAYINFEDDLLVKVEALSKANKVSTISDVGYLWRVNLESETYAHHFVENIGSKQDKEYQDMLSSFRAFEPNQEFLKYFKQVQYCKQYLDAIHYLTSSEVKKTSSFIKKYYNENIFCRDFQMAIEGRKYLIRGRIKPGIILPLLAKRKMFGSYRAEIILDKVLLVTLHSQCLTKLERMMKKNSEKKQL